MRPEVFVRHLVKIIPDAAFEDAGEIQIRAPRSELSGDPRFQSLRRVLDAVRIFKYFLVLFVRRLVEYEADQDVVFICLLQDGHRLRRIRP